MHTLNRAQICPSNGISADRVKHIPPAALQQSLMYRLNLGSSIVYQTEEVKWMAKIPFIPRQDEIYKSFVEYLSSSFLHTAVSDIVLSMVTFSFCSVDFYK